MEIVIDIDDEYVLSDIKNRSLEAESETDKVIINALYNGTPLQKGHGRLIDENYLLCILQCEEYDTCTWRNCEDCNRVKCIRQHDILEAPTIIGADTESDVRNFESKEYVEKRVENYTKMLKSGILDCVKVESENKT